MTVFGNRIAQFCTKLLFLSTFLASPVWSSGVPDGVSGMLKKAASNDNAANFQVVLALALETWPAARADILSAAEAIKAQWMMPSQSEEIASLRQEKAAQEAASRARGFVYYVDPKLWNGKAELGAGSSTGDTQEKSAALGLSFNRKFGKKWEHELDLNLDFARSGNRTTRERFVVKYEALWRPWESAFLLNYTELEVDRFSGYDYRLVENIGVGFDMFSTGKQKLRLEGGPGMRFSKLKEDGMTDTEYLGRVSSTYDLKLTDNLALKDRTSVIFASESTTIENLAQVSARINSKLAARLAFEVKYDSAAPVNTAAWDTSTRATLVYGF